MTLRGKMVQDLFDELQLLIRAMQEGSPGEEVAARTMCEEALNTLLGDEAESCEVYFRTQDAV